MAAVTFDTLKFVTRLEKGEFRDSRPQRSPLTSTACGTISTAK
jgi:hypothetical protein